MSQAKKNNHKENILVIDDNPDNISLLEAILSIAGYEVQIAFDGVNALTSIQSNLPDLILLDILMPEMDGYSVCRHLKASQKTADIPIIFISALSKVPDRVKAFEVGGVDYITKPFEGEEVLARIANQLNIHSLSKQLAEENANLQKEIRISEAAIRQRQQAEIALRDKTIKLEKQNQVLMKLARNPSLNQGNLRAAFKEITKETAQNLSVERVSLWLFNETETQLQCVELFKLSLKQYCEEPELSTADFPTYFKVLAQDDPIVAEDAHTDPRTQEYSEFYYKPRGIKSVLDTPIKLKGKTIGVLSNEHVGTSRHWTVEDQNFNRSVADLVTLSLEARERNRSENRYRELFEGSVDGIVITEDDGKIIDCNASYQKMMGYSLEELQQMRFQDLTPEKWQEQEAEIIKKQLEGYPQNFEKEYIKKDGNIFPVEIMAYCHKNDASKPTNLWAIIRDISAKKQAKAALIESERKYRNLVETSQDIIWSVDSQGYFTFVNQAVKQILGYEPEEIIGRLITDFEPQKKLYKDLKAFRKLLKGESIFQSESIQCSKDGRLIYLLYNAISLFDEQGNVIGATGSSTDITERVQIEAALRESEVRFSLAVDGVQDGIWDWDIRTGEVYLSPRWKNMLGYQNKELPNTIETWKQCLHPDDQERIFSVLQAYLEGGSLIYSVEFRARCKDGSYRWILARGAALRDKMGKPYRMCGSHTDISDRKLAETEFIRSKDLLESVFNESADAIFIVDGATVLTVDCNRRAVELFEATSKDELLNIAENTLQKEPFTTEKITSIVTEIILRGTWSQELEYVTKKGNLFWGSMAARLIHVADYQMHLVRITDITERKQQEEALRLIVEGTASATGNTFMHSCVRYLAQVLQVRYASISESIDPEHTKVRILAFWEGEGWVENQEYIVSGTPRQTVLNSRTTCYYPQHLQALFPNAQDLVQLNAESYIGVPLIDDDGTVLGIVSVLDVKPMAFDPGKQSILKIFAARAAAELKRQKIEEVLRQKATQEKAIAQIIRQMRSSLDIETIFRATTEELRQAINCDRVVVYRFNSDWSGNFVAESVATGWISLLQEQQNNPTLTDGALESEDCLVKLDNKLNLVEDTYLQETEGGVYSRGASLRVIQDIYKADFKECYINLLERFQARAYITVPIVSNNKVWGLLASYQNSGSRQWEATEINIVVQIGTQLGVALQQAELLAQTQQQSAQLIQAKEAAEVANRAKSKFVASMSHELRTPLNAILGFTQVMNRDASISPQQQEHLGIILRSGEHLLQLINDILEMTKIEAGRVTLNETSFDLYRLLDNLLEMLKLGATSKGLQLSFEFTNNVPQYVRTDEGKLRQILINLLDNAIKFTEVGTVTLRISSFTYTTPTEFIHNSNIEYANNEFYFLNFEVKDTGLGIAPEEIDLLFEAFTQTATGRKSMQGTGLGLPISRSFVQQLKGDITVESTRGKGTTFKFNIQINLAQAIEIEILSLTGQVVGLAPDQQAYRILVAEDDWASRQLLVNLLTSVGFQVREALNGEEAVALWRSWQPHLIWMDIRMPVMDGYEAIQQIRNSEAMILAQANQQNQMSAATVIIAITASAFEEQRAMVLRVGCDDFVRKPFQENQLFEKMSRHLGVRYLYKAEEINSQALIQSLALTKEALNVMPSEWLKHLYQAALAMDDQLVVELTQQIPPIQAELTHSLLNLVDNFRLDVIIDCIENG